MTLRHLRLFAWIACWLILIEVGLEYRAHLRGWPALLFGAERDRAGLGHEAFGPTAAFPFRSEIVEDAAPAGARRVWIASSSYAEDVRQPPDRVFAHLTAQHLSVPGAAVQVLNCSRGGLDIPANLEDLRAHGTRFAPDVIVLYQMSNDIDALTEHVFGPALPEAPDTPENEARALDSTSRPDAAVREEDDDSEDPIEAVQVFFEATSTYAQLKNQITSRLTRARVLNEGLGSVGRRLFRARVAEFLDTCAALGAEPVLCTFATSHVPATRADMPADSVDNLFRYNIHLSVEGWMNAVAELNQVLRELAAERGVTLVDLEAAATGNGRLFRDFTHFSTEGHELVAGLLTDALVPVLRETEE